MCQAYSLDLQSPEIPTFRWNFEAEDRAQERSIYVKLHRKCNIWVGKIELSDAKERSHSVKQYAKRLMSTVLVSVEDLVEIRNHKTRGIGFTKLFGKQSLCAVYGKRHTLTKVSSKVLRYARIKHASMLWLCSAYYGTSSSPD